MLLQLLLNLLVAAFHPLFLSGCDSLKLDEPVLMLSFLLSRFCLSGSLMYLNEATLLNNVRVRYSKDKIYVSVDAWEQLNISLTTCTTIC